MNVIVSMVATVANEGISADGSANPMAMKPRDRRDKTLANNFIPVFILIYFFSISIPLFKHCRLAERRLKELYFVAQSLNIRYRAYFCIAIEHCKDTFMIGAITALIP